LPLATSARRTSISVGAEAGLHYTQTLTGLKRGRDAALEKPHEQIPSAWRRRGSGGLALAEGGPEKGAVGWTLW
jgi:hypothetical protein